VGLTGGEEKWQIGAYIRRYISHLREIEGKLEENPGGQNGSGTIGRTTPQTGRNRDIFLQLNMKAARY
jgi:hypothetical protein